MSEAESMMQRLSERLIHSGFGIETEYPTEGVCPRCVLEIEPTSDFPKAFCVTLQFPSNPDLDRTIEIAVRRSNTKEEAGCLVSNTHFSLNDCDREELRQWVCQNIALAVKQYFEMRAKRRSRRMTRQTPGNWPEHNAWQKMPVGPQTGDDIRPPATEDGKET